MSKAGRPKNADRKVDPEEVFKLASIFCTVREIAAFFDCNENNILNNYSAELQRGRAVGHQSIRRFQYRAAEEGNVTMLIWLGRQYLEQVDRTEVSLGGVPDKVFIEEAKRRLGDFKQRIADAV